MNIILGIFSIYISDADAITHLKRKEKKRRIKYY